MVQKIEEIISSDNYDIKQTQLSIDKGDTIILKVDQEKIDFDFDIAAQFAKQIANLYPDNPILILLDGMTIEVIRNKLDNSVNFSYNKKKKISKRGFKDYYV